MVIELAADVMIAVLSVTMPQMAIESVAIVPMGCYKQRYHKWHSLASLILNLAYSKTSFLTN
jgi:hypothetical protein